MRDPALDTALRPVTDDDGPALIDLIGTVFAEYPGCVLDLAGLDADLCAPATAAARHGALQWVYQPDGVVVACVGLRVGKDGLAELKRLYVAAPHRAKRLGQKLLAHAEEVARAEGAGWVELWTDSRFHAAHRFYARNGYVPTGEDRTLDDPSHTTEYRYLKRLA